MDGLRIYPIKWSHSASGNKDLMCSLACGSQPGAVWMRNAPVGSYVWMFPSWQKCLGEASGATVLWEEVLTLGMGFGVSKARVSLSASWLWIKQHPAIAPGLCLPAAMLPAVMVMVADSPSETVSKPLESNASRIRCLGHEISPQ